MNNKVILIQGAMDIEIEYLINKLDKYEEIIIAGYKFSIGNMHNNKIIISKTGIGTINATIATTIAITNFHPDFVINQGIAGAHKMDIHIGDIVIGEKCYNINSYSIPTKDKNQGSNPFEWQPNNSSNIIKYADLQLVGILEKSIKNSCNGKCIRGVLGSGDIFNREFDRIIWINNTFRK